MFTLIHPCYIPASTTTAAKTIAPLHPEMIKTPINCRSLPSTPTTMSLLLTPFPYSSSLLFKTTLKHRPQLHSISFSTPATRKHHLTTSPICFSYSSSSSNSFNESSEPPNNEPSSQPGDEVSDDEPPTSVDECHKIKDLKRALVGKVYDTDFGLRASTEVRAEALELIAQLQAVNPNPAPTASPDLLRGKWVLVYTAFSELLPLLAAPNLPPVKIEKISQSIDFDNLTIENSITISSPVETSFSASATFVVQSPTTIQVQLEEGTLKPPEIKFLPESVQNAVAGIARAISGRPPLKIPIPGERTKSWLLITYLDIELRISRGDGGLFVLVREGSPLIPNNKMKGM